jgi:L-amino acid N-acyltransferase YncA
MTMTTRPATGEDAAEMAALLNEIIKIGGTTAYTESVTAQYLRDRMAQAAEQSSWTVAYAPDGQIMGFQSIEPHPDLPSESGDIGSFVRVGARGQGIGSALFAQSCENARALGYSTLIAVIRADNASGLAYYSGRGFQDYDVLKGQPLANGMIVDRVCKRYDLDGKA